MRGRAGEKGAGRATPGRTRGGATPGWPPRRVLVLAAGGGVAGLLFLAAAGPRWASRSGGSTRQVLLDQPCGPGVEVPPAELVHRRDVALNNPLDGRCEWFYGEGHLAAYREGLAPVCHGDVAGAGREAGASALGGGEVRCAKFTATHPHAEDDGALEVLCIASNLAMDVERLAKFQMEISRRVDLENPWEGLSGPPPESTGDSWVTLGAAALSQGDGSDGGGGGGGLRGTLRADCNVDAEEWGAFWDSNKGRGGQLYLRETLSPARGWNSPAGFPGGDGEVQCEGWVEHDIFLLADRWGVPMGAPSLMFPTPNFWHGFEEVVSTFVAYGAFGLEPATTQLLLADAPDTAPGRAPFPIHQAAMETFSGARPIERLEAAAQRVAPNGGMACFRRVAFSTFAQTSLLAAGSYFNMRRLDLPIPTPCGSSSVLLGLRDHLAAHLPSPLRVGGGGQERGGAPLEGKRVLWPRRSTRNIEGQDALLNFVSTALAERGVIFEAVDLAGLSYEDQIREVRGSDVLMGLHGAALTWAAFMRDGTAMVEVMPSEDFHNERCYCYQHLALSLGMPYRSPVFAGRPGDHDAVLNAALTVLKLTTPHPVTNAASCR